MSEKETCYHCGEPLPLMADRFCCEGCKTAYEIIESGGLDNYYKFRTDYAPRPQPADLEGLAVTEERIKKRSDGTKKGTFLVQGLHCASCVWLNEKILNSIEGVRAEVHLSTGRAYLTWDPAKKDLKQIGHELARTGYRLIPIESKDKAQKEEARTKLRKMAVAGFFTGNMMLISFALYAGYFDVMDGPTRRMFHFISFLMCIPILTYSASDFFKNALQSIRTGTPAMDMLTAAGISIAFLYSVYVTVSDKGEVYFDSVAFVTFAILIGRYLESRLRLRSMHYTENLMQQTPKVARTTDGRTVHIDSIEPGMELEIPGGSIVPVDSKLISETAEIDQSMLNGEYRPVHRKKGDPVYAGSKVTGSTIQTEATSDYQNGTLGRISRLTEESMMSAGGANHWAAKAGQYFIVFVFFAATATMMYWWLVKDNIASGVLNTIALLIVACPCALNLSVPAASISALQRAFREGCLMKDGMSMEHLARAKYAAFDKTGTLTLGKMKLVESRIVSGSYTSTGLLAMARAMQTAAAIRHPIADAFLAESPNEEPFDTVKSAEYTSGRGIEAVTGSGSKLILGSFEWMAMNGVVIPAEIETKSHSGGNTWIALTEIKGDKAGLLSVYGLSDQIRENAADTIRGLKKDSMDVSILTGDAKPAADAVAKQLNIHEVHAAMLPEGKVEKIKEYTKSRITLMIGDGINDSAALASAHCGISFVNAGQIGMTGADIILLREDLGLVLFLRKLSKMARRTIIQNLTMSLLYNVILIPMAFAGFIIPLVGAVLMSLSSISVVVNSMLIYRKKTGNG